MARVSEIYLVAHKRPVDHSQMFDAKYADEVVHIFTLRDIGAAAVELQEATLAHPVPDSTNGPPFGAVLGFWTSPLMHATQ